MVVMVVDLAAVKLYGLLRRNEASTGLVKSDTLQ